MALISLHCLGPRSIQRTLHRRCICAALSGVRIETAVHFLFVCVIAIMPVVQAAASSTTAAAPGAQASEQPHTVLAKALGLSEDDGKDLLALAASQGRPASVEAAAALFFEERRHCLMLLCHLLQVFLDYCPVSDPAIVQHATTLLRHLISAEVTAAKGSLLTRLCNIAQVLSPPLSLSRPNAVRGATLPKTCILIYDEFASYNKVKKMCCNTAAKRGVNVMCAG